MEINVESMLAAIGGGDPCGESIRYEPEFEQLEEQIAKLSAITPEPVDWGLVVRVAADITEKRSKDMLVASYLCYGLLETQGYAGLDTGLKVYNGLIQQYWQDMHPPIKRIRGRIGAAEWLLEKIEGIVEKKKAVLAEEEAVKSVVEQIKVLTDLLSEKLANDAPQTTQLTRRLRGYLDEFEQARRKQESARQAQETAAKSAAQFVEVNGIDDVNKAFRQCQGTLKNVVGYYRNQSAHNADIYRLNRIITWLPVTALPPNNGGTTQLPAPSAERVKKYTDALAAKEFETLLSEAEASFSQAPFWLDLHRYVASALENLGDEYEAAHRAVIAGLRAFLSNFPDVLDLRFVDGKPFADDQTRAWIQDEVMVSASAGGDSSQAAGGGEALPWREAEKEAKKLAAKGKFKEGIALFRDGLALAGSERERFHWRLYQAKYCLENSQVDIAVPQLEALDSQLTVLRMDAWEPSLVTEAVSLLLLAYVTLLETKKKNDAGLKQKAEVLYNRLCSMDLEAALQVGQRVTPHLSAAQKPFNPMDPFQAHRANV